MARNFFFKFTNFITLPVADDGHHIEIIFAPNKNHRQMSNEKRWHLLFETALLISEIMADLKTKPGDLFSIPAHDKAGNVGFVICRHIGEGPPLPLFEVFSKFYTECPKRLSEVDTATRLFRPVMMLISFHKQTIPKENKWRVLFHDPDYQVTQSNYSSIQIGFPESGHALFDLWEGGVDKRVTKSEVLAVEDAIAWQPPNFCIRVTAHLAGLIGPDETYDIWKVVGLANVPENHDEFDKRFNALMAKGMEACQIMAARFKAWDVEAKVAKRSNRPRREKNLG